MKTISIINYILNIYIFNIYIKYIFKRAQFHFYELFQPFDFYRLVKITLFVNVFHFRVEN